MRGPNRCELIALIVALGACTPLSVLQQPQTVRPGSRQITVGANYLLDRRGFMPDSGDYISAGPLPTLSLRLGVDDRTDAGIRIGLFEGPTLDVKRQLVSGPIIVSADAAVSYFMAQGMLIAGGERWHAGVRGIYANFEDSPFRNAIAGFAGATIGNRVRFSPELNIFQFFPDSYPAVVLALGVSWQTQPSPGR